MYKIEDFKIGDEIWWFKSHDIVSRLCRSKVWLVNDIITKINDSYVETFHTRVVDANEIWGRTRQEAWNNLKSEIEQWGKLE